MVVVMVSFVSLFDDEDLKVSDYVWQKGKLLYMLYS